VLQLFVSAVLLRWLDFQTCEHKQVSTSTFQDLEAPRVAVPMVAAPGVAVPEVAASMVVALGAVEDFDSAIDRKEDQAPVLIAEVSKLQARNLGPKFAKVFHCPICPICPASEKPAQPIHHNLSEPHKKNVFDHIQSQCPDRVQELADVLQLSKRQRKRFGVSLV
jgi:hypothetical protein